MEQNITPTEMEQLRKKALRFLIPGIVLAVAAVISVPILMSPVSILLFIPAIVCFVCFSKANKQFAAAFKQSVVLDSLSSVFTDLTFEPALGISREEIRETEMMQTGDRFSSNDLISGRYNGVPFRQSDVHIEEEHTDSEGHTSYTTIFRGRWMVFDFNKTFVSDLQVVGRHFGANRRKGNGFFGLFASKEKKMEKIELENEAFNKQFTVYAHDTTEAFYLLTPHMMEAMLRLREGIGSPIMLLFFRGQLHVAVNNGKDAFEPSLFRAYDPARETEAVFADTRVITSFVDEMRLDNDMFKI